MVSIDNHKTSCGIDDITWGRDRPRLQTLEYLLADYLISDYAARSSYQVMSVMDPRKSERADDHFYAMIGAITTAEPDADNSQSLHPSEYLMRVCEEKGDYSIIYSTGPRSTQAGSRWRPQVGRFPAVLPNLITFGSQQSGDKEPTHLNLDNMHRLNPGHITPDGLKAARWFAKEKDENTSARDVAAAILCRLRTLGFNGCGDHVEFEMGFFFPQTMPTDIDALTIIVPCELHWVTGGPALLLRPGDGDVYDFCAVGAFVGKSAKSGRRFMIQ